MLELSSQRKNKVNLSDYDYEEDIRNRMLISNFSMRDVEVLEEILYSPLKISLKKLERSVGCSEEELKTSLNTLNGAQLFEEKEGMILIDKEKRKYFEFEISRFDPQFKPDMEFLQGLLKKVPIHILPTWYATPRTSNNIFESIVEKNLLTPHIYQRYLMEQNFGNPTIDSIIKDLFTSKDFELTSSDVIEKYNLKREDFEEIMLILEFNFIACLSFRKEDDSWIEYITPFYEWKEYLKFWRDTEAPAITTEITPNSKLEFAFIEEMSELLKRAHNSPLPVHDSPYIRKLLLLKFLREENGKLVPMDAGLCWLDQTLENRASALYRSPQNRILDLDVPEKSLREAEKSIKRVLDGNWVFFDDFLKGVIVPLNEDSTVVLKRVGKHWNYQLPSYTPQEVKIIKATIFEWLYELGMVQIGKSLGKDAFRVTSFGKFFFND